MLYFFTFLTGVFIGFILAVVIDTLIPPDENVG